jgi:hypothetical protein
MPGRVRIAPPVFVDRMPEVICDADGVLMSNQLGDTHHSWRMSRHKALNLAALIVASVSDWERQQKAGNVRQLKPRGMV